MVTARLDTTSFFENVYPGADSPASGIVALLATAHTLKKVENQVWDEFFSLTREGVDYDGGFYWNCPTRC